MQQNKQLSDHFTLYEMIASSDAVKYSIDNSPNQDQIGNLTKLCNFVLEPIRMHFSKPVIVSSGYRCKELNKRIGGSSTSDHCEGKAADIKIAGIDNLELFNWIKENLTYKQLILEFYTSGSSGNSGNSGWVHVSYCTSENKNESLRAIKENGKTVYIKF